MCFCDNTMLSAEQTWIHWRGRRGRCHLLTILKAQMWFSTLVSPLCLLHVIVTHFLVEKHKAYKNFICNKNIQRQGALWSLCESSKSVVSPSLPCKLVLKVWARRTAQCSPLLWQIADHFLGCDLHVNRLTRSITGHIRYEEGISVMY